MTPNLKELAEFYRFALQTNLISLQEVVAWVDLVVMAEDKPDYAFIEACQQSEPAALLSSLSQVPGQATRKRVAALILTRLGEMLEAGNTELPRVMDAIYQLSLDYDYRHFREPDKAVPET